MMKILMPGHAQYDASEKCGPCRGTGRHQGAHGRFVPTCESCGGSGWEDRQFRMPPPDAVKFSAEYRAAKHRFDAAFAKFRNFNGAFAKAFKKEIAAERKLRRSA